MTDVIKGLVVGEPKSGLRYAIVWRCIYPGDRKGVWSMEADTYISIDDAESAAFGFGYEYRIIEIQGLPL